MILSQLLTAANDATIGILAGMSIIPFLFFGVIILIVLVSLFLMLLSLGLTAIAFIDCIQREQFHSIKENGQLVWTIILLFNLIIILILPSFFGIIIPVIYYIAEKRQDNKKAQDFVS